MGFLSEDYKKQLSNKRYWKPSEMPEGDNRFRIVQAPVHGWIDWKDDKPYRYHQDDKPKESFSGNDDDLKGFVACYVWDYKRKDLYILNFEQKGIIFALDRLSDSEEWGDLTRFDLNLHKKGNGQKVKYTLTTFPPRSASEEIKDALREKPANLEALFNNGDPFKGLNGLQSTISVLDESEDPNEKIIDPGAKEVRSVTFPEVGDLSILKERLDWEGIDHSRVMEWIDLRARTKNERPETVIKTCLQNEVFPKFVKAFSKWLETATEAVPF